jgi:hypothetical protein
MGALYGDAVEMLAHFEKPRWQTRHSLHNTNVYRAFAKWADNGSLQKAFIASVGHLSEEKKLDLRVLHGDGTNTVAKKGGMALATQAISIRKGRRSSPSPTTMATSSHPCQSLS